MGGIGGVQVGLTTCLAFSPGRGLVGGAGLSWPGTCWVYTGTGDGGLDIAAGGAGGGHLGVTAEAVGLGGWLGWEERPGSGGPLVGAGALPFTGVLCPSWNRGLESPMAVLGATFLLRTGRRALR